ncbi:MAG: FtsX-like permease family protein [Myxococcota bacterium]
MTLRRQRALWDYALGGLARRRRRTLAMTMGITLIIGLYGSALFLSESLREEWRATLGATPDLVVQHMIGGRPALIEEGATFGVADEPGVASIAPRVWGYVFVEAISANVTVVAAAENDARYATSLASGRPLDHDAEVPEAVLGEALAARFGLQAGDRMALPAADDETLVLEVAGIFSTESALHSADVLLTNASTARALLGIPEGQAADIAIHLRRPEEAAIISARVRDAFIGARVIERDSLVRTYELTFDGRAGLLSVLLLPCLAALLLLVWDRLTSLGDLERREIGVLKAIGWETRDVLAARLWESATIAFAGVWLGLLLAYVYVYVAGAPGMAGALFGWSSLYPDFDLRPAVRADHIWSLIGVVVVPFLGVSLIPTWRAATLDPDEAMR